MNQDAQNRLERIEILFSEQEYTIQTLNQIVTRHADKIDQLEEQINYYKTQLDALQQAQDNGQNTNTPLDEKPPHY